MTAETPSLPLNQLKLNSYALDDAMVVECAGRLTMEYAPRLKTEVKEMIPVQKHIILDLGEVAFMDRAAVSKAGRESPTRSIRWFMRAPLCRRTAMTRNRGLPRQTRRLSTVRHQHRPGLRRASPVGRRFPNRLRSSPRLR